MRRMLFVVLLPRVLDILVPLAPLGHPRDDAVVLDVIWVVGLDVGCEAVECPLKCIFRGGVHHARLVNSQSPISHSTMRIHVRIVASRPAPMR